VTSNTLNLSRLIKRAWYGGPGRFVRSHPGMMRLSAPLKTFIKRKVLQPTLDDGTAPAGGARLHIGCGTILIPGYFNVDITYRPGVACLCDLNAGLPFANSSLNEVYCCHVLEHFATSAVPDILTEFARALKRGGILRVSVPDLDAIFRCYCDNIDWFTPPHDPWLGLLYGGQTNPFDFHKTGFNFRWLKHLLHRANFRDIHAYRPEEMHGLRDASFLDEPFGVHVSLNVIAVRH